MAIDRKKLPVITLKPGREVPLRAGHPWVFSQGAEKKHGGIENEIEAGDLVEVRDHVGNSLGIGTCNPANSIMIRILSHDPDAIIDATWFAEKFSLLNARKKQFMPPHTNAYRVAHADADFLPGLILDRYGDYFVFQIHTAGMEKMRPMVIEAIQKAFGHERGDDNGEGGIRGIIERSDVEARRLEGLSPLPPAVHLGDENELRQPVIFSENSLSFYADLLHGQKTGFFLDQREARAAAGKLADGRSVLNLFSYTGAFSIYCARGNKRGGAKRIVTIDISRPALEMAEKNFKLNGLNSEDEKFVFYEADVMEYLTNDQEKFDMIICDPPAFAKSHKQAAKALRAYSELNTRCFKKLNPGGILITSSCSGRVTAEEFKHMLKIAAGRAGRDASVIKFLSQPFDHTERLAFPEGAYLKTFICYNETDEKCDKHETEA